MKIMECKKDFYNPSNKGAITTKSATIFTSKRGKDALIKILDYMRSIYDF